MDTLKNVMSLNLPGSSWKLYPEEYEEKNNDNQCAVMKRDPKKLFSLVFMVEINVSKTQTQENVWKNEEKKPIAK